MQSYQNASAGLKKMFVAQIGTIICTIIMVIPIVGTIIGGIGAFVFAIYSIVGMNQAGQDIPDCKKALILTIVNIVVSILGNVPGLGTLMSIVGDVVSFLIVFFVCSSVAKVLREIGAAEVAGKGELVWKINFVCDVASIVITILMLIPFINILAAVLSVALAIVAIVAGIIYLVFLYQSYNALA